jgi:hypothetical protein
VSRILRHSGYWAAWWSHPWADGEEWFEHYHALMESDRPGYSRHQRDVGWARDAIGARPELRPPRREIIAWTRQHVGPTSMAGLAAESDAKDQVVPQLLERADGWDRAGRPGPHGSRRPTRPPR